MKNAKIIMAIVGTLIILGTIFVACKDLKKPSIKETAKSKISNVEIYRFFNENKVYAENTSVADAEYSLCSERWIRDSINLKFDGFLHKMDMTKYAVNANDCDDFARAFTVFIKFEFKRAVDNPTSSVSVGEFYYVRKVGGPHAINFIIALDENKNKVLLFYEPQLKSFLKLTKEEISSGFFYGM
jgi:hypothetical protein